MATMTARSLDPADLRQDINRLDARTEAWISRIDEINHRIGDLRSEFGGRLGDLRGDMNVRFEQVDRRFDDLRSEMNARFDDQRNEMNARFEQVDRRFEQVDQRFDGLRNELVERMQFSNRLVAGGVTLLLIPSLVQWLGPAVVRLLGLAG